MYIYNTYTRLSPYMHYVCTMAYMWRKTLLLKYFGLPIPFLFFNLSLTLVGLFSGEMVFVSFEVEKMRMFLVQSVVRW